MKERKNKTYPNVLKTSGKTIVEDTTEYGEFIASFDAWLTPEEQKRRAKYLENISNDEE